MIKDFELVPHTADIKIRVYGETMKELFRNALVGMFQSVGPKSTMCRMDNERLVCDSLPKEHLVEVESFEVESLLVDFLSEALYLSDIYNEAYLDVIIHELTDTTIKATFQGVPVTGFDVVELKAVTYHDLAIEQKQQTWQTDIVFDI